MVVDHAHRLSDEELLRALAVSFPVEPVEPDAALLLRLSMAVAELRATTTPEHSPAAARRPHWTLPRRFSPVVFAGAVIGVVGAGTGISYAVGAPIPAAVHSIARSVGLAPPTTPTTLPAAIVPAPTAATAARQAESTLHQVLTESHPPPAVLLHDSAVLAHRLVQVGGDPTAGAMGTTTDGQQLLNEACRQLEGPAQAAPGSSHIEKGGATFPGCEPAGIWRDPSGPTSPSPSVPSSSTPSGTTEVPSPAHPGVGTGGDPVTVPVGGSSGGPSGTSPGGTRIGGSTGSSPGGSRTGGSTGTTPGTSRGHDTAGSSGDDPGQGNSPGSPGSSVRTQSQPTSATNPRSGATSN